MPHPKYVNNQRDTFVGTEPRENVSLLIGWRDIARYCAVCVATARRWNSRHGMPVARLPDGRCVSSRGLIDEWLLARIDAREAIEKREAKQ